MKLTAADGLTDRFILDRISHFLCYGSLRTVNYRNLEEVFLTPGFEEVFTGRCYLNWHAEGGVEFFQE